MQAPAQGLGQLMQQRQQGAQPRPQMPGPGMPQGAQPQQMPSPQKASPMAGLGSVEDRVAAYRGNPAPLQQRYAVSQDLLDLLALQKIKSERESAVRQMQMQMAQQQAAQGGEPPTIAQQREKEVMDMTKNELARQRGATAQQQQAQQQQAMQQLMSGIARAPGAASAAQPKMMATGGIVAFAEGGDTGKKEPDAAARAAIAEAQRTGDRNAMLDTLKKLAAAGYDVVTLIPRGLIGAVEDLANTRVGRALGLDFDASEITGSMTPMMDRLLKEGAAANQPAPTPEPTPQSPAGAGRGMVNPTPQQIAEATARMPASSSSSSSSSSALSQAVDALNKPAAAALVPPTLRKPTQTMPGESAFGTEVQGGIRDLLNKTPEDTAMAGRSEAMGFLKMPEEERAARAKQRAEVEAMDKAMFDPERRRQQELQNFLLGAGGQGSIGRALGAGARSSINFGRRQDELQRARLFERQKMLTDVFDLDKAVREKSFESGEKRFGEAAADVRAGAQLGTSMRNTDRQLESAGLDRDSRERIAELQAKVQQEVAQATRENTVEIKRQTLISSITNNQSRAVAMAAKAFEKRIDAIDQLRMMNPNGKLTPAQQTQLDSLEADRDAAMNAAGAPFDALLDRLVGASGGAGYTVKKITPPKK